MFYTLPTSLGIEWEFEYLAMERERFTLELVPDVHRDHGIRNAILVLVPSMPIRYHRLALACAWREGVRRFILLFADRTQPSEFATDELEQELRVLLDELGDGGGAPALRTALTRCAGRTSQDMQDAMLRLLDTIERVFPPDDEPPAAAPLPASFAREAAILDAIAPLVRAGTLIDTRPATLEETAALRDGTGGSHAGGWPYLPAGEAWPACPHCNRPAPCFLQLDMRDMLHATPPAHRLFVVYRCADCYTPDNVVVRHYDAPSANGRRPIDRGAPLRDDAERVVALRRAFMLPEYEILEADHAGVVATLGASGDDPSTVYWWVLTVTGMSSPCIPDHAGGWQTSQSAMHPACWCGEKMTLVSSTQWGDWWNNVWACPVHPDDSLLHFEK